MSGLSTSDSIKLKSWPKVSWSVQVVSQVAYIVVPINFNSLRKPVMNFRLLRCCQIIALILTVLFAEVSHGQEADISKTAAERMTPELLWKLGRLGEAVLSPDGGKIAYTVRRYELSENKGSSTLMLMSLDDGSEKKLLDAWSSIGSLQWIGDGETAKLFVEAAPAAKDDEEDAPVPQAWSIDASTGESIQVTDLEDGIANLKVAPTGDQIAFTLDIKLDKTVNELYEDLPEADARIIDGLMYRHWNAWHDYKYSHLHVAKLIDGKAGEVKDLMEGVKADCPVPPFGGSEQFAWSPEGKQIAYTLKVDPKWAESTDSNVMLVNVKSGKTRNMTEMMKGYDKDPSFSPDGKWLAYQSMERAGFESDRNRIMLLNRLTGDQKELTIGLDQNANGIHWSPDSKRVLFSSEYRGSNQVFEIGLESPGTARQVTKGNFNWSIVDLLPDGKSAIATRMNMLRPNELTLLNLEDASDKVLSHINDEVFETLELPSIEERMVTATDGKKIQCWVIYPPGFDKKADKKWPLLTYCQGGPQGQIGQWFSYRWNFHLMAANDYVIVAPNRRGLPGFGRKWNDQISGDWGGQAMKDILSATDSMLKEPYIDREKSGAVGASFGGYTVYWLMGNHVDRFQTMIAHCGVFNLESMYGSTEELFFVNWDLGGPYWGSEEAQKKYEEFSPHKFVKNWKTPLMVIHGQKDFRVPVTQGMEAFTAAQVNEVPSRFLYFPGEGHWVQKPQNGVLWHRVFFDWLDRYCK
jgi:dipeptidyl aminopeptidase/acylaminoacyl peptidase